MTRCLLLVGLCGIGLLFVTGVPSRLFGLLEDQPRSHEDTKESGRNSKLSRTLPFVPATGAVAAAPPEAIDTKDFSPELQQKAYTATLRLKTPTDEIGTAVCVRRGQVAEHIT